MKDGKEQRMNRILIVIVCGMTAACAVLCILFFLRDKEMHEAQEELTRQLAQARKDLDEIQIEKDELLEEEQALEAMAQASAAPGELLQIPFTVDLSDWKYLLVNELHPLAKGYAPQLVKTRDGQQVDERIKKDLEDMIDAASKEGLNLLICSSYRDYKKQDTLMDQSIRRHMRQGMDYTEAFFEAKRTIAMTGTSEHHTGLAVDIVGRSHQSLDRAQADTAEAKWLKEHAREYGFILRYPAEKTDRTMIDFESWHFRYVGREAAVFIEENGLCLEEFLELAQAWEERGRQASAAEG